MSTIHQFLLEQLWAFSRLKTLKCTTQPSHAAPQAIKIDPWDGLGSLTHSLGDAGPATAVACHPTQPLITACLSDGTVGLWDYQAASRGSTTGGESGGGVGDGSVAGGGDGYLGAPGGGGGAGGASPPSSPPRGRGSGKGGKDEK